MRIHDEDNDQTLKNASIYLTTSEAAELVGFLVDMIKKPNVKSGFVSDPDFEHNLKVYVYNQYEQSGFNQRQKEIIEQDS